VLSRTRCYADGSIFYLSVSQAKKVVSLAAPLQKLVLGKLNDGSLFGTHHHHHHHHQEATSGNASESPSSRAPALLTPGVQEVIQAGLASYGSYLAREKLDATTRPLKRLRTRFQKLSGFQVADIEDGNHEAWAEFAEDACRAVLGNHDAGGGALHPDPRTNAAYGEALIELAVMRYFYDREDGKRTLGSWTPTEMAPGVPLAEKFTEGRKRLWLKMAGLNMLNMGPL
jgi:hypothetical protein